MGMSLFGFKGGIGTPSRQVLEELGGGTVGAMVLANFGSSSSLVIDAIPAGKLISEAGDDQRGTGSIVIVLAFSTAEMVRVPGTPAVWVLLVGILAESGPEGSSAAIDALFQATVKATEEAILNALVHATTVTGRDGNRRDAIPLDRILSVVAAYRVLMESRTEA